PQAGDARGRKGQSDAGEACSREHPVYRAADNACDGGPVSDHDDPLVCGDVVRTIFIGLVTVALGLADASLAATPPDDTTRINADHELAARDFAASERDYQALLAKNDKDYAARLGLAESQLGNRELDGARDNFMRLSTVHGYEGHALQGAGLVDLRKGNLQS